MEKLKRIYRSESKFSTIFVSIIAGIIYRMNDVQRVEGEEVSSKGFSRSIHGAQGGVLDVSCCCNNIADTGFPG